MTSIVERPRALQDRMSGRVTVEDDPDYDEARRVWNADVDRRPAVIARCRTAEDVSAAVRYACEHTLEISVRGGAHSIPGASVGDGGMMINLSEMNGVEVDPEARRARAAGGALLADLDAATQEHGLAVPSGMVSHTGVAGLTLGGGMGWLTRMHGLSIDNLVSAQVVLADGRIVRAAEDENADLFWALRGGGGNFGVVTSFEFALHPVGPTVQLALQFYRLDQGAELMRLVQDTLPDLPRQAGLVLAAANAPPAPFVPEQYHYQPGYLLLLAGFGPVEEHTATVERARAGLAPLFEMDSPMPYTALQQLIDEATAWGLYAYEKGLYLPAFTDEVIEVVTDQVPRKTSPLTQVVFYALDEAYRDTADDATAFGGDRTPRLQIFIIGATGDAASLPAERAWVRGFYDALTPYALNRSSYVNAFAADDEDRLRDTYGAKYDHLARIKAAVDPDNVFHRNANITPVPG